MKTMNLAALTGAAFIFLLPLPAQSEIREGGFELTPFAGYNFFENDQNLNDRPLLGGRLGYNFTRHFAVEGVVEYLDTSVYNRAITGAKEGQYRSPIDDVSLTFYHIDAVYNFMPDEKFNPFVVLGFGGIHYSPDISTSDMAMINVGVGAKYWLTNDIAFRFDLRDYMVTEIMQETYHNVGIAVGVTFAFGGEPEPVKAQVVEYEARPEPEARAEEAIVVLASEPEEVKKVNALISEPQIEEKVVVLAFEDVHFEFDKSTLTKEAKTIMKKHIQTLKENPKAKIRIAGYTSASGTEDYNQDLSERRAKAIQAYLVDEGLIEANKLSTIGYGETKPAVHEAAPKDLYSKAAKANMRVLFEIVME